MNYLFLPIRISYSLPVGDNEKGIEELLSSDDPALVRAGESQLSDSTEGSEIKFLRILPSSISEYFPLPDVTGNFGNITRIISLSGMTWDVNVPVEELDIHIEGALKKDAMQRLLTKNS